MSRQIDLTKELTEDEVAYLEDRDWSHKLDENAANLMGGGLAESESEELPPAGTEEPYKELTIPDLKTLIADRNADRAEADQIVVEAPGNRPELVAAVVADDAKTEAAAAK